MNTATEKSSVSEWADAYRVLDHGTSIAHGRWDTDRAPYQREIMDAFSQPSIRKIIMMTSVQTGKTEMMINMLGWAIDEERAHMVYVLPTREIAKDYSERRVEAMICSCPTLKEKVSEFRHRKDGNEIILKKGDKVTFIGSNQAIRLISRPHGCVFMDMLDYYAGTTRPGNDPISFADTATRVFYDGKIVMAGIPSIEGKSRLEMEYMKGTREEWQIACPKCGAYHSIYFKDIRFVEEDHWEDAENCRRVLSKMKPVTWRCPYCAVESTEHEIKRSPGRWFAHNPEALEVGVRSFRLNSYVNPWMSWAQITKRFIEARDNPRALRHFCNCILGEPWQE